MKYFYVVINNGDDYIDGVVSEKTLEGFNQSDLSEDIPVQLTIEKVEKILEKMKSGKADLTLKDLKEFADECLNSGGG